MRIGFNFFLLIFISFGCAKAQTTNNQLDSLNEIYSKPKSFGFVTQVPQDLWLITKSPTQKENWKGLGITAVTTGILLWQDENLIDVATKFGKFLNLSSETTYNVPLSIGGSRIIKIPSNINTGLYQMGEGGTSMYIAAGLFIYGKIKHDYRSLQTASDLTETFFSMGISDQILKRISGRQTPSRASFEGGRWNAFPSFNNFKNEIDNYDSFPSGHLSTMMATVTVLSKNYPEKKWIKPVGYSLIGLTGFAMMNNKVHWAGDYPLAIALGYVAGCITVNRHLHHKKSILNFLN
jgi:hypothetical protein